MASTFNSFDILSQEDSTGSPQPTISPLEPDHGLLPTNPLDLSKAVKTSWADLSEEDDPIGGEVPPPAPIIPKEPKAQPAVEFSPQEKLALKAFDYALSKRQTLRVTHNVRFYNKETGEAELKTNTREFRIVAKNVYESTKRLISKYNPYRGSHLDYKEQREKIKLTNHHMGTAYKDPDTPGCFIYPVVLIKLDNDKVLTRNEVKPGSKCRFSVSDIAYYPPYEKA